MDEIDLFGFKYLSGLTEEEIEKLLQDIDSDDYDGDNDYGIERVIKMDRKADEARKFLEEDFQRRNRDAKKVTFNFYYDNEKLKEREDNGNKFVRDDRRADGAKFF